MRHLLIGACALLAFGAGPGWSRARAQGASEFAAVDARRKACETRDSSNAHLMACTSVVQEIVDARLNAVYGAWTEALKHPTADNAKDDAEIMKRLVAAERAWIVFRDDECNLQSASMLGGTGEPVGFGACRYEMTKARVKALEADRTDR